MHGDFSELLCPRASLHGAALSHPFAPTQELLIDRVRARGAMLDRLASFDAQHPEAQDMHRDPKPTRWYQRKKTRALVAPVIWRAMLGPEAVSQHRGQEHSYGWLCTMDH